MVDIGATIKKIIPSAKTGGMFVSIIALFIFGVIFIILTGVITYFVIRRMKFNKKIVIFERINDKFQPTRKDKAMEVKFSTSGDTIFYLQKNKKYLPNPRLQSGRRVYYYFIRQDGEWINFELTDLDEESRKMGAKFLDKEMRYARTQIQKGLKERYDKPGFWQLHGQTIMNIVYYVVMGMMVWLALGKFIELVGSLDGVVDKVNNLMETSDAIIA